MDIRRLLAVAAVAVTAGCGTTVSGVNARGGPGGEGLSLPSNAAGATPSAGPGGGSVAAPGAGVAGLAGGTTSSGGQFGGGGGGSAAGVSGGAGNGPGITASTIYVGESYDPTIAAADAGLGAAGANPGDTKAETDAVINYLNTHGGIAHRKIAPVWHRISASDQASTSAESTCQAWTHDSKVFVFAGGDFRGAGTLMDECAKRAGGIEMVGGQITMETTAVEAGYPGDFNLHGFSNDRAMRYTVGGLADLSYFTKGARVGIVTWDDPYFHYGVSHAAMPALAALGIHNVPVAYISSPSSYGDLAATSAAVNSAVLKYSQTVDHVIIFDGASGVAGGGILTLEWMQQAHSQRYHPRYGLNSSSGFNALAGDLPADELRNSVGVGWEPVLEQTSTDFAAMPKSADAKLCAQIMSNAGQQVSSANGLALQYMICDYFFLLKQALDSIKGPINQQTAIAAFNAIGSSHQSIVNFGAHIDSGRRDLPYLVRNMTYQSGCSCFRYVGRTYNPGN